MMTQTSRQKREWMRKPMAATRMSGAGLRVHRPRVPARRKWSVGRRERRIRVLGRMRGGGEGVSTRERRASRVTVKTVAANSTERSRTWGNAKAPRWDSGQSQPVLRYKATVDGEVVIRIDCPSGEIPGLRRVK